MAHEVIRQMSPEVIEALGIAINESRLLGFEVDEQQLIAGATFEVLTLPLVGNPPEDTRVLFIFHDIGRLTASLRPTGNWTEQVPAIPFAVEDLDAVVRSFEGQPISGWDFFDDPKAIAILEKSLSVDKTYAKGSQAHSIVLFQEDHDRLLEFVCWFGGFEIRSPEHKAIALEKFIAGGRRWWEAMRRGDPRTLGSGIVALKDENSGSE